jgi:DNA-binding CsgD family transcriptional regulator/tetratricopeptide (TPR) repeat protein
MGKTLLLAQAHEHARKLGLAVAPGRASELDRVVPLTSLLSALRAAAPRPVDLSALREHDGDRLWYVDRLGEALEAYTARRPLLVIVDDTHWCDELSALALRVLVPRLSSSPLRWLLARRPVPADSPGQDAVNWLVEESAEEISLAPLDEDAVAALCQRVLDARPDATVLALAARGQGNPFLLEQFLTALKSTGQILVSNGIASVVGDDLPVSFLAAVDQRLRGLSVQVRWLLQAGAIFGRPFSVHAAAHLMGVQAPELLPAAEDAVSAGLLLAQGSELVFAHDLLRQAVYGNLSGPARATMHRDAALVVREEGRSAVEIAEHLMRAGPSGDREAVALLCAAADEVAERAPSTAADLVLRALEMLSEFDEERPGLSARAVDLLASAGRAAEARALGETTLRLALDPPTRATVLLGLADALKHAGENRTAADYARRGLAEPGIPAEIQARLHASAAHALLYSGDLTGADRAGTEADRLGLATGEQGAASYGVAARSLVAVAQGRLDEALGYALRAVETADAAGGPAGRRWHPRIWLGNVLTAQDRFEEAADVYATGRREAEELGTGWSLPLWHYFTAALLSARGRLDEAAAEAEAGVRIAEQLTARALCVPLHGQLTRLAILRGQIPLAREHLRRMERLRADGVSAAPEDIFWTIASVEMVDEQPQAALRTLSDIYAGLPDRLLLYVYDPGNAAELVRVALAAGDPPRARVAADAVRELAQRNPDVTSLTAAAAHTEGLLDQNLAVLRRAVEHFRYSPRPLARASALADTAHAEYDAGNHARAVQLLEQAIDEATGCGAQGAVDRMTTQLRGLGGRARPPAAPRRTASPLAGLTPTELNLAKLVAQGLTNREIAEQLGRSPHTVDSHIRNIFAKAGVKSRVALTRLVLGGDLPP